jgi:hypothetical protein
MILNLDFILLLIHKKRDLTLSLWQHMSKNSKYTFRILYLLIINLDLFVFLAIEERNPLRFGRFVRWIGWLIYSQEMRKLLLGIIASLRNLIVFIIFFLIFLLIFSLIAY